MEPDKIIEVKIDLYNRIHVWKRCLIQTQKVLDLHNYMAEERIKLFKKEPKTSKVCIPLNIIDTGFILSLDMASIYYMKIFSSGYGVSGKMISNRHEEIELVRRDMIDYVCRKLTWSEHNWNEFQNMMSELRDGIIAHFDATKLKFHDDNLGYSYKHGLMEKKNVEKLSKVISLMKKFVSRFKVYVL